MTKPLKELDAPEIATELLTAHPQLRSAINLATHLHAGQHRGPRRGHAAPPYIEHPLRVAARLSRAGVTDTVALNSAVLHDTVEDCEIRIAQLADGEPCRETSLQFVEAEFGAATAEVVGLLTNSKTESYLDHVTRSVQQNPRALLDKTSDWLDNAGSLHHTPKLAPRRCKKYRPLTAVFLEEWDRQYEDLQLLLNGNYDVIRSSILRAGFRLEVLTQRS